MQSFFCSILAQSHLKVLVVLNLSKATQNFSWQDTPSQKEWNNVFNGNREPVERSLNIEPWGYAVYTNK